MRPGQGILIGLPIAGFFVLVGIAVAVIFFIKWWRHRDYNYNDSIFGVWIGAVIVVGTIVITAASFWPYQKEYHYWTPVEGTVQDVSSRILPSGEAAEQKFVVRLADNPTLYGIQDTRAALLKRGDHVSLSCKRVWEFGSGEHGWDCRWGEYR